MLRSLRLPALPLLLAFAAACSREEERQAPAVAPAAPPSPSPVRAEAPQKPFVPLPAGPRPKHVFLFTVDTLRADHLGCYGHPGGDTPHLDRLAREGVLFEQADAPRGVTWSSLTSLITGLQPISHGVRRNHLDVPEDVPLLTHLLAQGDYRASAFLSNFGKGISDREGHGFEQVFRADYPRRDPQAVWDERGLAKALEWIRAQAAGPTFTWLHFMEPHNSYDFPDGIENAVAPDPQGWIRDRAAVSEIERVLGAAKTRELLALTTVEPGRGATYADIARRDGDRLPFDDLLDLAMIGDVALSAGDRAFVAGRYHAQVASVDRRVGRMLALLDELDLAKDTLFVFSADHGDELFEHSSYCYHNGSIHEGVLRVPLLWRWPGRLPQGHRVRSAASLVDVVPTIAELFDLPLLAPIDGQSLVPLLAEGAPELKERVIFGEMQADGTRADVEPPLDAAYTARDARWKLIKNPSGASPRPQPMHKVSQRFYRIAAEELYDLESDPHETENLMFAAGREQRAARDGAANAAALWVDAARARSRLASELENWLARAKAQGVRQNPESRIEVGALAGLGYLSGKPELPPERVEDPGPAFARAVGEAVGRAKSAELAAAARAAFVAENERRDVDAALRAAGL